MNLPPTRPTHHPQCESIQHPFSTCQIYSATNHLTQQLAANIACHLYIASFSPPSVQKKFCLSSFPRFYPILFWVPVLYPPPPSPSISDFPNVLVVLFYRPWTTPFFRPHNNTATTNKHRHNKQMNKHDRNNQQPTHLPKPLLVSSKGIKKFSPPPLSFHTTPFVPLSTSSTILKSVSTHFRIATNPQHNRWINEKKDQFLSNKLIPTPLSNHPLVYCLNLT